jgi:hypothetical protein
VAESTESTKIIGRTIVGTSLLTGVIVFAMLHFLCRPEHKARLAAADDSPVTVRGGSIVARGGTNSWSPVGTTGTIQSIAVGNGKMASSVYLDGVALPKTNAPIAVPFTGLTTNWELTLDFRDNGGGEDSKTVLNICSALNATQTACDPSGSLSGSGTVYLVSDGKGKFGDKTLDTSGISYDACTASTCTSSTCTCANGKCTCAEPKCNHIFKITTTGIPNGGTYKCLNGECIIGVDQ